MWSAAKTRFSGQIVNVNAGKCLDLTNGYSHAGVNVELFDCHADNTQAMTNQLILHASDGTLRTVIDWEMCLTACVDGQFCTPAGAQTSVEHK